MRAANPSCPRARAAVACQERGYCGPFVNQALYDAVPGWEGIANCCICGNTVFMAPHRERERAASKGPRPG